MIEPSSSEEDEDEVVDAPPQGPPRGQNQVKVPNGNAKATPADGTTSGGNADLKIEKVTSPTSSQNSEKNLTEAELRVSQILLLCTYYQFGNGILSHREICRCRNFNFLFPE